MSELSFELLSINNLDDILDLTQLLNPNIQIETLKKRQQEMFEMENYKCFGVYDKGQLIGVSGGWITVRLYSGKQLELDHVIINPQIQSSGVGAKFMSFLEKWSKESECETIELNTYVGNGRSHKFYFNQGFEIIGYHFQKHLKEKAHKNNTTRTSCS